MSEDTFVAARAHRDRQRAAEARAAGPDDRAAEARRAGPDEHAVTEGYAPVTLEDGTPVPISEAAVVLCDCAVTRVGIDADSVPMDLGRTQRLFTGEQRRAILARDRECIWPTCHMPARWLQIHHRIWWGRDNGTTNVENGVALCSFHHQEVHRDDLTITRIPGPPTDGPPGRRRRPRGEISMVRYEFRDPAGRLVVTAAEGTEPTTSSLSSPCLEGLDEPARRDDAPSDAREARSRSLPSQRGPTRSSPPVS
jgi:hypothetical protein